MAYQEEKILKETFAATVAGAVPKHIVPECLAHIFPVASEPKGLRLAISARKASTAMALLHSRAPWPLAIGPMRSWRASF